ncbi:MAG: TerB family tellurite resistance protein, partial [Rubrobacter sp.]
MSEKDQFSIEQLPEEQRVAFYGSLFAMGNVDGQIQREELDLIYERLDTDGLSDQARQKLYAYAIEPPALQDCLKHFADAPETVRFALMFNFVEVTLADRLSLEQEETAIAEVQRVLGVSDAQVAAMKDAAEKIRYVRERGIDDNHAADVLKSAAAGLSAVGTPILVVSYLGVSGLSAAGITSGLAAVGLGLGMVPGIGVAVLVGAGVFIGVNKLLDTGRKRKKEAHQHERERKAQLAIQNLQETINHLISRIT